MDVTLEFIAQTIDVALEFIAQTIDVALEFIAQILDVAIQIVQVGFGGDVGPADRRKKFHKCVCCLLAQNLTDCGP